MPIQIVIPDNDPMVPLLRERAIRRGYGSTDSKVAQRALRKRLPKLVRELVKERLSDLNAGADPMAVTGSLAEHPT